MGQPETPGTATLATTVLLLLLCLPGRPLAGGTLDDFHAAVRLRELDRAVTIIRPLATSGDAEAPYQLASLYRAGRGVRRDHEAAFSWLEKAARQKHVKAGYNLGVMYENGWGPEASITDAWHWYRLAAAQGHKMAQRKIDGSMPGAHRLNVNVAQQTTGDMLRHAIIKRNISGIRLALKNGADTDKPDAGGTTALMDAAEQGDIDVFRLLLAASDKPDQQGTAGSSALHIATRNNHGEIVSSLLAAGANPDLADDDGNTAQHIAAGKKHMKPFR